MSRKLLLPVRLVVLLRGRLGVVQLHSSVLVGVHHGELLPDCHIVCRDVSYIWVMGLTNLLVTLILLYTWQGMATPNLSKDLE